MKPATLFKKRLWPKFLKKPFLAEQFRWLLLTFSMIMHFSLQFHYSQLVCLILSKNQKKKNDKKCNSSLMCFLPFYLGFEQSLDGSSFEGSLIKIFHLKRGRFFSGLIKRRKCLLRGIAVFIIFVFNQGHISQCIQQSMHFFIYRKISRNQKYYLETRETPLVVRF